MIGIDTNILVSAVQENHIFFEDSRRILQSMVDGEIKGCVCDKVLYETLAVLMNLSKTNQKQLVMESWDTLCDLQNIAYCTSDVDTLNIVSELMKTTECKKNYVHDIVIAAVYLQQGVDTILTYNTKAFDSIPSIKAVLPRDINF